MIALKDKERALREIALEAERAAKEASYVIDNRPLSDALAYIIGEAVSAGLEKMLSLQYTDDDFERDITLKP